MTPLARRRVAPAVLACALLAGCGSTVSTVSDQASTTSQDGLSAPQGSGDGGPAATGGIGSTQPLGGAPGMTAGSSAGTDTTAGNGTTTSPSLVTTPKLTKTSSGRLALSLGVVYLKGLDQAYKAANGGKSATTDSQADYAAVIKALNARPEARVELKPSYYAVDASSTQPQADQVEAACAHFTSDVHADVVVSYSPGTEGALAKCLQKKGIPLVDGSVAAYVGESIEQAVPTLWQPNQLTLDRVGALEASYLISNHWADNRWPSAARCAAIKQPRIGVVTFDRADWRAAYSDAVAPTFKALGHPVYDVDYVAVQGSTAEQLAQASSGAQSAVLKFANDCIDHVAFVSNVALDYLFMNVAQQQGYNPRYGLSSLEAPPVIVQNVPHPTAQLHGSIGPGWSPYSDVDMTHLDAMSKRSAQACLEILKKAGHAPSDNNSTILAMPSCDGPMFTVAVVERWLSGGRAGTLLDAVNAMGTAYQPAGTFAADINASHHDGASAYRGFAYDDKCTCFTYATGLRKI